MDGATAATAMNKKGGEGERRGRKRRRRSFLRMRKRRARDIQAGKTVLACEIDGTTLFANRFCLTFCLLAVGASSASLALPYAALWLLTRFAIASLPVVPFTLFTALFEALPPAADGGVVKDLVTGTTAPVPPPLVWPLG